MPKTIKEQDEARRAAYKRNLQLGIYIILGIMLVLAAMVELAPISEHNRKMLQLTAALLVVPLYLTHLLYIYPYFNRRTDKKLEQEF